MYTKMACLGGGLCSPSAAIDTGSALALHCGKVHVQSQWKGRILTPNDIKFLKLFKFELDVHDYIPEIYTSANFHFNLFSGTSLQIGEILRFCDFFLVS